MKNNDAIVKGIEKVLSFLPYDLSKEQKQSVEEIKGLLSEIDNQSAKEQK